MYVPQSALPANREAFSPITPQNATFQDTDGWFIDYLTGNVVGSGVHVNQWNALKVATVYACIRCISEDISKLPLILYKQLEPRGKERAKNLPLYRLLHDEPNPLMGSMSFRQRITVDALRVGNGYAEIERNAGGEAVALWPLISERVYPVLTNDNQLYYEVWEPDEGMAVLPADRMFHLKAMGDGYVGWSIIKFAKETIGGAMAAEEHGNSFFGDAAVPSGVLTHPGKVNKESADRLSKSWEDRHAGKRRIAVLEQGMDYKAMSISNEDSQFIESRQFSVEEICRWFRVPPHKVMHLLRSTFSNIEEQNTEWVVDCLTSWAVKWEEEISRKLIPKRRPDLKAEHLFDGLLRGDSLKRAQYMQTRFMAGSMSPNDIRDKEGENPVEGGDAYFVPANMVTLEVAIQGPPEPAPSPQTPPDNNPPPGDSKDQQARRAAIVAAHVDILADAVARLLKVEADRVSRWAGKENGAAEIEKFYTGHAPVVVVAVQKPLEAFGASYWHVRTAVAMPDEVKALIAGFSKASANRHLSLSRRELSDPNSEQRWAVGERAKTFAEAELRLLALRLDVVLSRYRPEWLSGDAA